MAVYTINQQPVYVQECGPPNGPLAVLIHGWASSSFTWKPVLPSLSRRYRCLAVDLPGFGQSPAPAAAPTIAGYADMVADIIERATDRAALVLGHSMGGQIAATLALRHPLLVDRLVLLNPAMSGRLSRRVNMLLAPHVLAERFPFLEWLLYVLAKTPLDYTDFLLKPSNFAERAQVSEEDYQHIRADARRRGQGRVRAACFGAMQKADLRGQMGRIAPPALVIWGAEDDIVPLRDAGAVAAEWPMADLRIIPNAGHWPQFEQTDITLRHIALFLGLPPETAATRDAEHDMTRLQEIAQFLNNSEIGGSLTPAQRLRLASLLRFRSYEPGELIVSANTTGDEMFIVMDGTLEVWLSAPASGGATQPPVRLALMQAGQVVGELALLENAERSADLRAGRTGVMLLALSREALNTLAEDEPAMGMRLMQNLAVSLGKRLRLQNWKHLRAEQHLAHGAVTTALGE
ncbi:MAG TPA: alpha/beta fold hydrolase [Roseiflexaceae bacterium]|nr:alpha/beta fold hydrolase [Roseiflexaceae bacterium]